MKRPAIIGFWVATICAAFAIGVVIESARKPQVQSAPSQPELPKTPSPDRSLFASLQKFRNALAEKENLAASLRAEIEEVRGKLLPPLSPEDEKWLKVELKEQKVRGRYARWETVREKARELEKKILQRKDKALRAKTLDEVAFLLKSEEANDVLLGLTTLCDIFLDKVEFDKDRFKPLVLGALDNQEWEVRSQALQYLRYLGWTGEREMAADVALRMMGDPESEVRIDALWYFEELGDREKHEEVAAALRALLQDGDKERRGVAFGAISSLADERTDPVFHQDGPVELVTRKGYDYYDELKEAVMEASKNPESAQDVLKFWWGREALSEQELKRATEIIGDALSDPHFGWNRGFPASPELRQAALSCYLRIAREDSENWRRANAVWRLQQSEDNSLIPELKALAASEDAEGIERQLEEAIRHLEQYGRDRK